MVTSVCGQLQTKTSFPPAPSPHGMRAPTLCLVLPLLPSHMLIAYFHLTTLEKKSRRIEQNRKRERVEWWATAVSGHSSQLHSSPLWLLCQLNLLQARGSREKGRMLVSQRQWECSRAYIWCRASGGQKFRSAAITRSIKPISMKTRFQEMMW